MRRYSALFGISTLAALAGCSLVYGLGDYEVTATSTNPDATTGGDAAGIDAATPPECFTNQECTDRATAAGPDDAGADAAPDAAPLVLDGGIVPAICVKSTGKCGRLLSQDCTSLYGDYLNDNSIVIGTLLATSGTNSATNIPRQQAAVMAAEEINSTLGGGGVPAADGGAPRPLVVLSCNTTGNLTRVGTHLVDDLAVPAVVGPNLSQDTLDFTSKFASKKTTVIMSPAATASSIASAADENMTWCAIPSDAQRAKLTIREINDIETYLHSGAAPGGARNGALKLAIVYRDDAFGQSTSASIAGDLKFNGVSISDPLNAAVVKTLKYAPTSTDSQAQAVTDLTAFKPDVVALFGTTESVTKVLYPYEKALETADPGGAIRPYWAMIDPNKVKDLTDGLSQAGVPTSGPGNLRPRLRGTGIATTDASAPVFAAFNTDYQTRWGTNPRVANMSTTYDTVFAFAYAMAATADEPVSGPSVAKGLALLGSGTEIQVGRATILKGFQEIGAGRRINPLGSFGHLRWDNNGNIAEGKIEVWCIGLAGSTPTYESSGLTMDISTQAISGTYTACD